jgi:hypothetical protein
MQWNREWELISAFLFAQPFLPNQAVQGKMTCVKIKGKCEGILAQRRMGVRHFRAQDNKIFLATHQLEKRLFQKGK